MTPETWYSDRLSATESTLAATNKHIRNVSALRLLLFVATVSVLIALWEENTAKLIGGTLCLFIPFLFLLKYHNKLFKRKLWLETKAEMLRKELMALNNDYKGFDEGKDFVDTEHPYTFDLDIFGKKSLFQAINRTCTQIGRATLANWLQNHLHDKTAIEARQACIQDLCKRNVFREEFAITGNINITNHGDEKKIREWIASGEAFTQKTWVKALIWGVPITNATLFLLGFFGVISLSWFGLVFFGFITFSFSVVKRATILQEEFAEKLKTLNTYAQLIALIQKENWEAEKLQQLSKMLEIDGKSPAEALNQLSKELNRLDLRNNQLLYVILEGSMFFQLHQMARIEKWKIHYGQHLTGWLETVGKMDALCSLATFAFNHPDYTYASISTKPFCFMAKEMGHPLMPAQRCVKNDASIPSRPFFLIITGANMAGKSTYLRTIGINYLLACLGAPVCCEKLEMYPSQLITSLRTSDSLSDNESYFFAELKRLKRIIDQLNNGEELFIILDEILKGTNSTDKQKGSFNLIRQFILSKANGIIATHDLLLGELANLFPEEIRNYCFEADITNDELTFSYKIREGIAQNMNACFLMKKMGIAFD